MQARRAFAQQAFAHFGYHVQSQSLDGGTVVGIRLQLQAQPARDFRTAGIGKANQFGKTGNRHDAGDNRNIHPAPAHIVEEAEIGIRVVKILGNRRIRSRFGFTDEMVEVVLRTARLRMIFGIGGDFDMEMAAVFVFNQFHQFVGITQPAGARAHAGRNIAAQGDNVAHAHFFIGIQKFADFRRRHTDTG